MFLFARGNGRSVSEVMNHSSGVYNAVFSTNWQVSSEPLWRNEEQWEKVLSNGDIPGIYAYEALMMWMDWKNIVALENTPT